MSFKRTANILAIPGFISFIALMLWGEKIEAYNIFLYWTLCVTMLLGMGASLIQSRRDRDQAIADAAVARYKETAEK